VSGGKFELIFGQSLAGMAAIFQYCYSGELSHGVLGAVVASPGLPLVMHVGEDGCRRDGLPPVRSEDAHDRGSLLDLQGAAHWDVAFHLVKT
jgi:hypothetical protein